MFIIANKRSKNIEIPDLKIFIRKNQVLDLDRMKLPISPEDSKSVKQLIAQGLLVHMNKTTKAAAREQSAFISTKKDTKKDTKKEDHASLTEEIKRIIKKEIKNIKQPVIPDHSNDDVLDGMKRLEEVVRQVVSSQIVTSDMSRSQSDDANIGDDLSEEALAEIHAKVVSKLSLDTNGSLDYLEQDVEDDDVANNAAELEGLFG